MRFTAKYDGGALDSDTSKFSDAPIGWADLMPDSLLAVVLCLLMIGSASLGAISIYLGLQWYAIASTFFAAVSNFGLLVATLAPRPGTRS